MRLLWQTRSNPLAWWWMLLTLVSSGNIALWIVLYQRVGTEAANRADGMSDMKVMVLLCGAYVFGCAFRSMLPRADVQRICVFDTWLSSVLIGRSVATVAEVCFAVQWAIVLNHLGGIAGVETTSNIALVIVPLIVVAQCCSWYGVLTTNCLANAIENSIWAVAFFLVAIGLYQLMPEFDGLVLLALKVAIVGIAGYLAFLVTVDVPMYLSRWKSGPSDGKGVLSLLDGLRDVSTRWVVSHDIAHWKDEIAWMSLYFTMAVWASLGLCFAFSLGEPRPLCRVEPAAHVLTVAQNIPSLNEAGNLSAEACKRPHRHGS